MAWISIRKASLNFETVDSAFFFLHESTFPLEYPIFKIKYSNTVDLVTNTSSKCQVHRILVNVVIPVFFGLKPQDEAVGKSELKKVLAGI
jgi:hypothetical protein